MESLQKNIQLMLEFLKDPFLVLHFSYYTLMTFFRRDSTSDWLSVSDINDLPDNVICDIAIYADDTTLYSKCDKASDLWQQLELASKLQSDLRDTVDWGKKRLVDFNAGKTQLVSFHQSDNNIVLLMWEWMGLFNKLNWSFNLFYEVSFSWVCSVSL